MFPHHTDNVPRLQDHTNGYRKNPSIIDKILNNNLSSTHLDFRFRTTKIFISSMTYDAHRRKWKINVEKDLMNF